MSAWRSATTWATADLDDEGIVTFLQDAAPSVGAPVFVHPVGDMPTSPRLRRWMAQWLTGMPAETHLSILGMSFLSAGVLGRMNRSLRICSAHGGGSFPTWIGRMDNAWHRRPDVIATSNSRRPSTSTGSRWTRWCSTRHPWDSSSTRWVHGQVMVGSDYPYPFGERPAGGVVRTAQSLDDFQRTAILSGNALRFLFCWTGRRRPVNRNDPYRRAGSHRATTDTKSVAAAYPGLPLICSHSSNQQSNRRSCGCLLRVARSRTRLNGHQVFDAKSFSSHRPRAASFWRRRIWPATPGPAVLGGSATAWTQC